jgi:hypothetical protein
MNNESDAIRFAFIRVAGRLSIGPTGSPEISVRFQSAKG